MNGTTDSTTCIRDTTEHQKCMNYFMNQVFELNLELLKQHWYIERQFNQNVFKYHGGLIS